MRLKLIIFILLIILFTIFVVQNTEPVSMRVFIWHINELPKIVLLTITLLVGIILGIFISAFINKKKKDDKTDQKKS
ncbi:MAG TPA: LapA family protein [Ignavibacteriaceae bacterium]